ncbi:PLASMID PROTEIN (plasmid) [Mycetohabitans rhizoxinica HKI 454]|uniref:PLASMID PROTEIN n=1 Tax=Mycetohabitans rhizoxinica (strain DSM 19002 / CIP 109453 / HKI 454) TaxID=882378 RepID=E5AVX7_MYCRK|nr:MULTISPECIES: hypothetical protein [Mycetohabitans]MCG1048692.1 hypothetical protein [Mycetohabitans sp. B6]CBW77279.1 PLASMID PROTEIN [Mycetohabitans rhizoxinica HKI 454]
MTIYSNALDARVQWALHRISVVAGDEKAAQAQLSLALTYAERSAEVAARKDEDVQCPALLADVPQLRAAFMGAVESVRDQRQKRRTREGIEAEIEAIDRQVSRSCGLSYELFVMRFSAEVDYFLETVEAPYQALALEVAATMGYATPAEREEMQNEIEESGGCPLTGIDPDCCPCGRHP